MKILLPIKEKYFDMLVEGSKNVEIRKHLPNLKKGDKIFFYFYDKAISEKPKVLGYGIVKSVETVLSNLVTVEDISNNYKTGINKLKYWQYIDIKNNYFHFLIHFDKVSSFAFQMQYFEKQFENYNGTDINRVAYNHLAAILQMGPEQKYIILEK